MVAITSRKETRDELGISTPRQKPIGLEKRMLCCFSSFKCLRAERPWAPAGHVPGQRNRKPQTANARASAPMLEHVTFQCAATAHPQRKSKCRVRLGGSFAPRCTGIGPYAQACNNPRLGPFRCMGFLQKSMPCLLNSEAPTLTIHVCAALAVKCACDLSLLRRICVRYRQKMFEGMKNRIRKH